MLGKSTWLGKSMVASMRNISGRLPRKLYFASAKPPRLLSATISTVCVDARKSELKSQSLKGISVKSFLKLSVVNDERSSHGKNAELNMFFCCLNDAQMSHAKGVMLTAAS